jgi:hypothetical protein
LSTSKTVRRCVCVARTNAFTVGTRPVLNGLDASSALGDDGAIDIEEMRKEIARVMEGGEKAFRLRKEKYGF